MSRRTARGNRYGIVLAGLVLLVGGGLGLARGFGALERIDFFGPARADAPLLSNVERDYAGTHVWVWYVLAAIAVVAAALALRWILVQMRSDRVRVIRLERDRRLGNTDLSARALLTALGDEVESYWGVHRADARLTGTSERPRLTLSVGVERDADLAALRTRITTEALPHAREALDREELPTLLTLRLDSADRRRRTR
jgi:hypothetical protein